MRFAAILLCALAPSALADESVPEPFLIEQGALKLPTQIYYETGSDKLKPESDEPLALVKRYLDAKPYVTLLRIEVHSDALGAAAYNQTLTEKRALAVARYL